MSQLDVKAAFDNLEVSAVIKAMNHWHIHPRFQLVAAKEATSLSAIARLAGVESDRFAYRKTRQGGKESTKHFNL
eukprot:4984565-Karenia_brevis.AAC.1